MSLEQVLQVSDLLERAALADDLMWTDHPRRLDLREVRGAAIREALEAGRSSDDIARRLSVTVADLEWMTASHSPTAA